MDYAEEINDLFGHIAGDGVIQVITRQCQIGHIVLTSDIHDLSLPFLVNFSMMLND
jgi:hypothetical protein